MGLLVLSCPVDEKLNVSCRRLALRKQGLHPYHLQQSEDPPRRITFCQWFLQKVVIDQLYHQLVHRS
jgi:hypothetical protein